MSLPPETATINRRAILIQAWPIIIANISWPLLGVVDTAVIGNTGTTTDMGAIALGALVFTFVYWSFGCLRMSTTGFTAQALGANNHLEVRAILARSLMLATVIGVFLVAFQQLIRIGVFEFFHGTEIVEANAQEYFAIRIWGAPAALANFALMGTLVGLGKSKWLLVLQVFLNGSNMILDIWLAGVMQLGATGIALGTLIAEWTTFFVAIVLVLTLLDRDRKKATTAQRFLNWSEVIAIKPMATMLTSNGDIFIRTLALVFGFIWFTDSSARFGDTLLAANHVLLQFLTLSAFFLDGYAFVVEAVVGKAKGANSRDQFDRAVRLTTELAAVTALLLAALTVFVGDWLIFSITDIDTVRNTALIFLPLTAAYVFASFPAFQLDGIFIGATETKAMRNASVFSLLIFLMLWWVLPKNNSYLWLAWVSYVICRALSLMVYYPALRRSIGAVHY